MCSHLIIPRIFEVFELVDINDLFLLMGFFMLYFIVINDGLSPKIRKKREGEKKGYGGVEYECCTVIIIER